MGIAQAGFKHSAIIERDEHACGTISANQSLGSPHVSGWPLHRGDVSLFNYNAIKNDVALLAGGPPCQPFSLGGKHKGNMDGRDMFPQFIRAVRELRPRAILVENVKGLLRKSFATYFEYIILQLSYPDIMRAQKESWQEHLARLERTRTKGSSGGLSYNIVFRLLNAADYGVPQRRERVFIVGFRADTGIEWSFPHPTHSRESLLWEQHKTGEYWDRHKISASKKPRWGRRELDSAKYADFGWTKPQWNAWRTVRDAISDLPDPRFGNNPARIANHGFNAGARIYPGHTGSPLDEPAKTLKAGGHGVPGGENMLLYPDGGVRYFTIREAARLQTFPDDYVISGSWSESMRQLGNAVPVMMAEKIAVAIAGKLRKSRR